MLTDIWRNILKVDSIGIHENFFALGGHSLIAMQVVARIRSQIQPDFSLRTLFEKPTVSGLARIIEQSSASKAQGDENDLNTMLENIESLSDAEAQAQLEREQKEEE